MLQKEPGIKSLNLKESPAQDFITIILSTLKKEDTLTLKEKLEFTYILSLSKANFTQETVKEFCEEECDLTLINWIWKSKDKLKKFKVETELREKFLKIDKNVDEYFPKYNILLIEVNFILELLINILNLFSFLPITSFNILNLNLYQKLNKIKEYIKLYAGDKILSSIDLILIKWKSQIEAENEQKIEAKEKLNKLGIKRKRSPEIGIEDLDTEIDSVEDDNVNNINNNITNNKLNIDKKNKNKNNINKKVSFDLTQNTIIYFHKNDAPFQISLDKIDNKIFFDK